MGKILVAKAERFVKSCKFWQVQPQFVRTLPHGRVPRGRDSKNEIALLSTEAVSSAISDSYELPKQFVRWQPDWPGTSCQFVFRQAIGGRCFPVSTRLVSTYPASLARRKICFHKSHIPCETWCQ